MRVRALALLLSSKRVYSLISCSLTEMPTYLYESVPSYSLTLAYLLIRERTLLLSYAHSNTKNKKTRHFSDSKTHHLANPVHVFDLNFCSWKQQWKRKQASVWRCRLSTLRGPLPTLPRPASWLLPSPRAKRLLYLIFCNTEGFVFLFCVHRGFFVSSYILFLSWCYARRSALSIHTHAQRERKRESERVSEWVSERERGERERARARERER